MPKYLAMFLAIGNFAGCLPTDKAGDSGDSSSNHSLDHCDGYDDATDDDEVVDGTLYYRDADADGYGDRGERDLVQCEDAPRDGYVSNMEDCNDGDATVHPEAEEVCDDEVDQDCDDEVDEDC